MPQKGYLGGEIAAHRAVPHVPVIADEAVMRHAPEVGPVSGKTESSPSSSRHDGGSLSHCHSIRDSSHKNDRREAGRPKP
jgi:hypothetical protein